MEKKKLFGKMKIASPLSLICVAAMRAVTIGLESRTSMGPEGASIFTPVVRPPHAGEETTTSNVPSLSSTVSGSSVSHSTGLVDMA